MDLWSSSTCVKKTLRKKGSGEEIGMAFVRVEEVKTRLEDLAWAEDDGETLHRGTSALELTSSNAMKSPSVLVKGLSFQEAAVSGRSKGQGKSGVKRHLKAPGPHLLHVLPNVGGEKDSQEGRYQTEFI